MQRDDSAGGDIVGGLWVVLSLAALERLHYLRRTGALDDAEYEAAKDRIIGGSP